MALDEFRQPGRPTDEYVELLRRRHDRAIDEMPDAWRSIYAARRVRVFIAVILLSVGVTATAWPSETWSPCLMIVASFAIPILHGATLLTFDRRPMPLPWLRGFAEPIARFRLVVDRLGRIGFVFSILGAALLYAGPLARAHMRYSLTDGILLEIFGVPALVLIGAIVVALHRLTRHEDEILATDDVILETSFSRTLSHKIFVFVIASVSTAAWILVLIGVWATWAHYVMH